MAPTIHDDQLFFMLLCSLSFCYDTTSVKYEYVVFYSSIVKLGYTIEDLKIGKKTIDDAGGQTGFMFRVLQPRNTNYYDVFITTNAQSQNTFLNNSNVKKCYYKKGYACLDNFGNVHFTDLRGYPKDWDFDWSVHESTP